MEQEEKFNFDDVTAIQNRINHPKQRFFKDPKKIGIAAIGIVIAVGLIWLTIHYEIYRYWPYLIAIIDIIILIAGITLVRRNKRWGMITKIVAIGIPLLVLVVFFLLYHPFISHRQSKDEQLKTSAQVQSDSYYKLLKEKQDLLKCKSEFADSIEYANKVRQIKLTKQTVQQRQLAALDSATCTLDFRITKGMQHSVEIDSEESSFRNQKANPCEYANANGNPSKSISVEKTVWRKKPTNLNWVTSKESKPWPFSSVADNDGKN